MDRFGGGLGGPPSRRSPLQWGRLGAAVVRGVAAVMAGALEGLAAALEGRSV